MLSPVLALGALGSPARKDDPISRIGAGVSFEQSLIRIKNAHRPRAHATCLSSTGGGNDASGLDGNRND
jgi:hypothetical protein